MSAYLYFDELPEDRRGLDFNPVIDAVYASKSNSRGREPSKQGKWYNAVNQSSMVSISKHKTRRESSEEYAHLHTIFKGLTTEELLYQYHRVDHPEATRKWLREEILMKIFFLIPHAIKKYCKIPQTAFEDAVQNMVLCTLQAIEMYNPDRGCPFTHYLIGYYRSALAKTIRDNNVVPVANARRRLLEAAKSTPVDTDIQVIPEQEQLSEAQDYPLQYNQELACRYSNVTDAILANIVKVQEDFDAAVHNKQLVDWLVEAFSAESGVLSPVERRALIMHFGLFGTEEHKYKDIAMLHKQEGRGCTCGNISQIISKAIKKLRDFFIATQLEEF